MKTTLSAQSTAFFTKNGYIEFEIPHAMPTRDLARDLWRQSEELKQFILRKLGPIALVLTGKKKLRLGLDQWISQENRPKKISTLKEMFCLQGLALAALIAQSPLLPSRRSPLGILPLPSCPENVLFFRPDLILDWPHVTSDVFLILFTFPNAVYVHNTKDPATHFLKQFGYNFGDCLKSETHPLVLV